MASDPEASADTKSTAIGGRAVPRGVVSKLIKISSFRPPGAKFSCGRGRPSGPAGSTRLNSRIVKTDLLDAYDTQGGRRGAIFRDLRSVHVCVLGYHKALTERSSIHESNSSIRPYAVLCAGERGTELSVAIDDAPTIRFDYTQRQALGVMRQVR